MRSIAAGQNVAEKNLTKGVARMRFFGARAANGGEAYTVLLCEVGLAFTSIFSYNKASPQNNNYTQFWNYGIIDT
jgi:hypothetical protein